MEKIVSPQIEIYMRHFVKSAMRSIKDKRQLASVYERRKNGYAVNSIFAYMNKELYGSVVTRIPKGVIGDLLECFKTLLRDFFIDISSKGWKQKIEALRNSPPDRWAYDFEMKAQDGHDFDAEAAWHKCDILWHTAMLTYVKSAVREIENKHIRKTNKQ